MLIRGGEGRILGAVIEGAGIGPMSHQRRFQ